jgi:hypothetical protein
VSGISSFGAPKLAGAFARAGVRHIGVGRDSDSGPPGDLAWRCFVRPLADITETIEAASEFTPDIVLHDPFSIYGLIAARRFNAPAATLVTFPGFGALGEDFVRRNEQRLDRWQQANARYKEEFGVDILGEGYLPVFFPSTQLSLIPTTLGLATPLDRVAQPKLHGLLAAAEAKAVYIGPCTGQPRLSETEMREVAVASDTVATQRNDVEAFPYSLLDKAKLEGKRIVVISFGTVVTDFRFESPVGGAPSGQLFLRKMITAVLEALSKQLGIVMVIGLGFRLALNEFSWPDNAIVRNTLPLWELLQGYADAFVTHHGSGSQTDSLLSGVPMISVPAFGDQIQNAKIMARRNTAIALWSLDNPYETCTGPRMQEAVQLALYDPSYRLACLAIGEELQRTGGPAEGARRLMTLVT